MTPRLPVGPSLTLALLGCSAHHDPPPAAATESAPATVDEPAPDELLDTLTEALATQPPRATPADAQLAHYLLALRARVMPRWNPPAQVVLEQPELSARVLVELAEDGVVLDVRIQAGSGHQAFDLSCLEAVRAASPLPLLPEGYEKISSDRMLISFVAAEAPEREGG